MSAKSNQEIRSAVRSYYAGIVTNGAGCCSQESGSVCCADAPEESAITSGNMLGYSSEELAVVPKESNLGLGCGNPQAIASIVEGETVLDLGSGAGFDCFLASKQVGATGRIIGVDMTPAMIDKARRNSEKGSYGNIEFRLGEIEHLPVADQSVDVIISNCVINLSTDKDAVFREAFRVLKPGGRIAIADIVARAPFPVDLGLDMSHFCGCMTGAPLASELNAILEKAGFIDIRISTRDESREFIKDWVRGMKVEDLIVSATIEGRRPQQP